MRAKKISIGPWTVSAKRAETGTLLVEVLLGDVSHARIELDQKEPDEYGRSGEEPPSKLEVDMKF